jgi:hypothetical protein
MSENREKLAREMAAVMRADIEAARDGQPMTMAKLKEVFHAYPVPTHKR